MKKDRRGIGANQFGSVHISGSPTATATGTTTTTTNQQEQQEPQEQQEQQEPQETRRITTTATAKDCKNNKKTTIVCVILGVKCCKYRSKRQVEVPKCKIQRPCSKISQIPRKTRNQMSKTVETPRQMKDGTSNALQVARKNREKRKPKESPKLQRVPETFCKVMQM